MAVLWCLRAQQGKIKALVGGADFDLSQFNRVTQAKRQLGSIFKPLFYTLAMQQGARMDDICVDEPVTIIFNNQEWSPQNYDRMFRGPVTRAYSLYRSLNTCAIQTLYTAGIQNTIAAAQAVGMTHAIPAYPSLALGCVDATLLEATVMFNCIAQQGMYVQPYYLEWVKDNQGKKIYKHKPVTLRALDWAATSQVTAALTAGIEQLRKKRPNDATLQAFARNGVMGKTGTTNDARSCFFVAATPRYTAAAYMGNDANKQWAAMSMHRLLRGR